MLKYVPTTLIFLFSAGQIVTADLYRTSGGTPQSRDLIQPLALEGRSASCPATCTSNDGTSICIAIADVCCQNSGQNPFSCPTDYPYCCEDQLCGNSASCAGPVVNDGGSSSSSSSTPKKSLGSSGLELDGGVRNGLAAAVIAIGAMVF
ncbi:hypothetical protein BJ170DRAFT_682843 [Xylariales sp. AK1849]|nr:hypothetical protein BJ170DRAFT_682843 [Xylariales sp. AK1849]